MGGTFDRKEKTWDYASETPLKTPGIPGKGIPVKKEGK